jgi:molybdopterin-guanine dinucleotide biosynthesis protein A
MALAGCLGLILAGGRGSRVGGADKGLLEWQGRPLVAHVAARLRPQVEALWIVANRNTAAYAVHADRVLADARPGFHGPLEGLATALAACGHEWLLCAPVDVPGLPGDLATRLHAAAVAQGSDLAVAHDGRHRQVLCLLARSSLAGAARDALARGDAAVHSWQDACGVVEVDFSDQADAFANLNVLPTA